MAEALLIDDIFYPIARYVLADLRQVSDGLVHYDITRIDPMKYFVYLCTMMLVCKRWSSMILRRPLFWSVIVIDYYKAKMEFISRCLDLATSNCPLQIYVMTTVKDGKSCAILDNILSYCHEYNITIKSLTFIIISTGTEITLSQTDKDNGITDVSKSIARHNMNELGLLIRNTLTYNKVSPLFITDLRIELRTVVDDYVYTIKISKMETGSVISEKSKRIMNPNMRRSLHSAYLSDMIWNFRCHRETDGTYHISMSRVWFNSMINIYRSHASNIFFGIVHVAKYFKYPLSGLVVHDTISDKLLSAKVAADRKLHIYVSDAERTLVESYAQLLTANSSS